MTDRELLELAAKAAGIELDHYNDLKNAYWLDRANLWWSPLTDDGDALRLAARLRMQLSIGDGGMVLAYAADAVQGIAEDVTEDIAYCTRRAIVRAVAAIGMVM